MRIVGEPDLGDFGCGQLVGEELADLQAATTTKDAKISDLKSSLSAAKKDITALRATLSNAQESLASTEKDLVALREDYASRKPKLLSTNWGFPPPKPTNHSLPYKPNWNKKPSSLTPQKPDCQTPNSNSVLRTPIQKF